MSDRYYDMRDGAAKLAVILADRGWVVYDYHKDQSDMMTDYYSPASWSGTATKADCVLVVMNGRGNPEGKPATRVRPSLPGDPCPHCHGTGHPPDAWMLSQAQAAPRDYHAAAERRPGSVGYAMLRNVVSPIGFGDDGKEKCGHCWGRGHKMIPQTVEEPRPRCMGNPHGCTWHIERNGQLVVKGRGMAPPMKGFGETCGEKDKRANQHALSLADRIDHHAKGGN